MTQVDKDRQVKDAAQNYITNHNPEEAIIRLNLDGLDTYEQYKRVREHNEPHDIEAGRIADLILQAIKKRLKTLS